MGWFLTSSHLGSGPICSPRLSEVGDPQARHGDWQLICGCTAAFTRPAGAGDTLKGQALPFLQH